MTGTQLFWQLPWAGPCKLEGAEPAWAVMPSPGMGDAKAVCVPVSVDGNIVSLALSADITAIAMAPAPLDTWTRVASPAGAGHTGFLCLVGYDQPAGDIDCALALSNANVEPWVLVEAIARLNQEPGKSLAGKVLGVHAAPAGALASVPDQNQTEHALPRISLTLAFACCQYPSGLLDALPAERSFQRLANLLADPAARKPERLLLLGDQIYADATAGLLDPVRLDDRYRVPYEELLHMAPLRTIMGRIPVLCMLDDHEINDNWDPYAPGAKGPMFVKGTAAYWKYQRGAPQRNRTWMRRSGPGWSLFMADTRTHRTPRSESTLLTADILGTEQRLALESWLQAQPRDNLKLVSSPAMLLPRAWEHIDEPLHLDGWQGFPQSLHGLLQLLCDKEIRNVVFLSGDAHLGCDVEIHLTGPENKQARLRSIHAPALYAPLPFANEQPWNLKIPDTFQFGAADGYTCEVSGRVNAPHRDGYRLLEADRRGGVWTVTAHVH